MPDAELLCPAHKLARKTCPPPPSGKSEAGLDELQGVALSLEIMASVRFLSFLFVMPFVLVDASSDRLHASGAELSQASEPITVQVNYDGRVAKRAAPKGTSIAQDIWPRASAYLRGDC